MHERPIKNVGKGDVFLSFVFLIFQACFPKLASLNDEFRNFTKRLLLRSRTKGHLY